MSEEVEKTAKTTAVMSNYFFNEINFHFNPPHSIILHSVVLRTREFDLHSGVTVGCVSVCLCFPTEPEIRNLCI